MKTFEGGNKVLNARLVAEKLTIIVLSLAIPVNAGAGQEAAAGICEKNQPKKIVTEAVFDSARYARTITFEMIEAISPDLMYCVRRTSQFFDPPHTDDAGCRSWTGLYEIVDLKTQTFRLVDTLPTQSESFVFCAPGVLMYTVSECLKNSRVMLRNFLKGDLPVELVAAGDNDSLNSWIRSVFWHQDVRLQDSLVVHSELHGADTNQTGLKTTRQILIRRLDADSQFPVLKRFAGSDWPRFSGDGEQVLAEKHAQEESVHFNWRLLVYDIATDSTAELVLPSRFCSRPQRISKKDPIYYLATDQRHYNIRCCDPKSGTDSALTHFLPPISVSLFQVTADSIVYEVVQQIAGSTLMGGRTEKWWETIRIAP